MKKGDVAMAKHLWKQVMSFQPHANQKKLFQDACQRLMLHSFNTTSRTSS